MADRSTNLKQFGNRLKAGRCNMMLVGDSLVHPIGNTALLSAALRKINVPANGVIVEARTGQGARYGVQMDETVLTGVTHTQKSTGQASQFGTLLSLNHARWHEMTFASNIADAAPFYEILHNDDNTPDHKEWHDSQWVGSPNTYTCRVIYYKHDTAPSEVKLATKNASAAVTQTITDMNVASGSEGFGYKDIIVNKTDADTTAISWGVQVQAGTTDETGEGIAIMGARWFDPNGTGCQVGTMSVPGVLATEFGSTTGPNRMSDALLAQYMEITKTDTIILWLHDDTAGATYAANLENVATRFTTAINTARGNDPSINTPLIVFVSTWEDSALANIDTQPAALQSSANTNGYTFIDIYNLVNDKHGAMANWGPDFLEVDNIHPKKNGSDEFMSLFFSTAMQESYTLLDGLISRYGMDDASNATRLDSRDIGNDLPDTNSSVPAAAGFFGNAASFDGVTGTKELMILNASIAADPLYTGSKSLEPPGSIENAADGDIGDFTFMILFNMTAPTILSEIMTKFNGAAGAYGLRMRTNSRLQVMVGDGAVAPFIDSPTVLNNGQWYWATVVHIDGASTSLYLDGVSNVTYTTAADALNISAASTNVHLAVGKNWASATRMFNGLIDDFAFWRRALSPKEISDITNGGAGLPYSRWGGGGVGRLVPIMAASRR